ncbi:MAG: hypothetical protein IKS83_04485, partial [Victivallales bacterium]|nr:hypothetical protein [Victivallales bacterium]
EFSLQDSRGVAALEPSDGWPADDRRFFWAQPEPPAPVLLLLPDGAADGALADELEFFFERALTSERDGAPPHFQTHPLGASALPLVDLQNFALVILAGGAERLPEEAAPLLQAYRAAGRSIIFLPGNAPVAAWRFLQNAGLLTASEQGLLRHSTGIGPLPETSPFTRIFPPTTPSDLHLFPIRQVLRVSPAPNDLVLLRTLDGHPALLQHHDDNPGSLYAFTFAFQQANTDFPLTQSFLPILRELCTEATCAHSATLRLNCGDIFPETHALNGALLPLPPDLTTLQPGLTRLGNHPVEINPPAVESIPEATDLSDLQRVLRAIPSAPLGAPPETASRLPAGARNLQRWCFAALAILAVLELLLMLCGVPVSRKTERHFFHTLWH